MYLTRAPASSVCALLWCGMSLGPGAAGGCLIRATLSLLSGLQVYLFVCQNKNQNISTLKIQTKEVHLVKVLALELQLQNQLSSIKICLIFLCAKEALKKLW